MNALELRGLTKHYKDFTLGPLDLTLPGGTICGLIGENGAGKSTTIKLILDMLQRDGGTVTILGRDNRTTHYLKRQINKSGFRGGKYGQYNRCKTDYQTCKGCGD